MSMTGAMRAALLLGSWLALSASASTVVQMDFDEVVESAELVFEGEVLSVESRQTAPGRIHTFVRFRILDVVKGEYADDTLELRYLGGQVDGRLMRVTDMELPGAGESGLYFVESMQRPLIHPLVGWSQGHYRIETDERGQSRVYTADHRPVVGETPHQEERETGAAVTRPGAGTAQSGGASASGLRVLGVDEPRAGMSADAFKNMVREVMARQPGREAGR